MVIVRESPRSKQASDTSGAQWPPKSPFAALLSSPSGRKKWQSMGDRSARRSISPSARRIVKSTTESDIGDEEEDEETIRLKLEEIQAKLKLKELQRKAKKLGSTETPKLDTLDLSNTKQTRGTHLNTDTTQSAFDHSTVQIPLSPTRITAPPVEHLSPARRKLGLHEARRAEDVSLKRPRSNVLLSSAAHANTSITSESMTASRPLSFSERLLASRDDARSQEDHQQRIDRSRSKGFNAQASAFIKTNTVTDRRPTVNTISESTFQRPHSSHALPNVHSSDPAPHGLSQAFAPRANITSSQDASRLTAEGGSTRSVKSLVTNLPATKSKDNANGSSVNFDLYSEIHLSKRHIAHPVVAREMETREVYTLPRLLKEVKAPHYDAPDCERDFVVFAVLASKSSPFSQKAAQRTSDEHDPQEDATKPRNKFMVLTLCDLKWEVDCFLFGTAFDQFWKLTPGTLLAILNPGIMPPKNNSANGRFSLKLGSSEDCVMEIGIARDLGYCDSIKRDGQKCSEWVDKRKSQLCEFHLNMMINKERKGRMEVNTMFRGKALNKQQDHRPRSENMGEKGWDRRADAKKNNHISVSAEHGRVYAVPSAYRGSTAKMLDREDTDALHGMTRDEASRKRIAAAQKERDLAKKLGEMGNGIGAEYLRVSHPTSTTHNAVTSSSSSSFTTPATSNTQGLFDKPKAAELGLLGNRASEIHLSPAKDRKRHFGLGLGSTTTTAGGAKAMGWGGAKKPDLLQPRQLQRTSPVREQPPSSTVMTSKATLVRERTSEGSLSPKKRARFALEKGIREPGRESLGGEEFGVGVAGNTRPSRTSRPTSAMMDDDDLEIV